MLNISKINILEQIIHMSIIIVEFRSVNNNNDFVYTFFFYISLSMII